MASRIKVVAGALALMVTTSACGAGEPKFNDAWMQKHWPESGRAYASFKVQGNMDGLEGCSLHIASPYDTSDLYSQDKPGVYSQSEFSDCSKTASIKKWLIRDDYLVGTFRCRFGVVVDGQEKAIIGEVGQKVFIDESPIEPGGWRNRGECRLALFDAEAAVPIGKYTDNMFFRSGAENAEADKTREIYID